MHKRVADGWLQEGRTPAVLSEIRRRDALLAVWHRADPNRLGAWLDGLEGGRLPSGRAKLPPCEVSQAMADFCAAARTPDVPERDLLVRDVFMLAGLLAALAECREVELRVEPLDHDGCSLFHVDRVDFRLLSTYRGPGTEWVPPGGSAEAVRRQAEYEGPCHRLPRFAAGVFKGAELSPDAIVHRSPPIAGTGAQRLLVCLTACR
jgi:hypothetical protein